MIYVSHEFACFFEKRSEFGGRKMSEEIKRRKSFRPFRFITGKIRNKLLVITIVSIVGVVMVGLVATVLMNEARETAEEIITNDAQIIRLTQQIEIDLLQALQLEKKYLLNYQNLGFQNARAEYIDRAVDYIKKADDNINTIKDMSAEEDDEEDEDSLGHDKQLEEIQQRIGEYVTYLTKVVSQIELRGYKDQGVIGELEKVLDGLDADIHTSSGETLRSILLTLKSSENDYLLTGERKFIISVNKQISFLKETISQSSDVSDVAKKEMISFADKYSTIFQQIIAIDRENADAGRKMLAAMNGIQPAVQTIVESVTFEAEEDLNRMVERNELNLLIIITTTVLTALIGLMSALFISGRLTKQIDKIMDLFGNIGIGDFSSRAEIVTEDELGEMAESLNAMLDNTLSLIQSRDERDSIQGSIMTLLTEISDLAGGDLTARAEVTEDITGALADSFNTMAEQLSTVVRDVKDASAQVGSSSHDVDAVTQNLSKYSEAQAEKVQEAIAKIEEMTARFKQVSENATKSAEVSSVAKQNAQEGSEAVKRTNEAMASIKENMRGTSRTIKRLGESSQEIGNIVQIINDIADRTSILALNASIQASMAGDAGRGFAVVAEEVQRLAERSAESTKQIESLIQAIQGDISAAGLSMETSIQYVVDGTDLADEAHSKLGEIEGVSNQLAEIIENIADSAKQQSEESEEVTEMMQEVGELSEQTSGATRETAASMEKITTTSKQLEDSIATFKIEE